MFTTEIQEVIMCCVIDNLLYLSVLAKCDASAQLGNESMYACLYTKKGRSSFIY